MQFSTLGLGIHMILYYSRPPLSSSLLPLLHPSQLPLFYFSNLLRAPEILKARAKFLVVVRHGRMNQCGGEFSEHPCFCCVLLRVPSCTGAENLCDLAAEAFMNQSSEIRACLWSQPKLGVMHLCSLTPHRIACDQV
jgi:hypothetical protein